LIQTQMRLLLGNPLPSLLLVLLLMVLPPPSPGQSSAATVSLHSLGTSPVELQPDSLSEQPIPEVLRELSILYPESPDLEPMDSPHAATNDVDMEIDGNLNQSPVVTPQMDSHVKMVSSILAKLQRAFEVLKTWKDLTDTSKAIIDKECVRILTLADTLAEKIDTDAVRKVVQELRNIL
ncbi:hypothetical protein KI387_041936, partial [Taxus chinensis]